jgi:hypothetical protein
VCTVNVPQERLNKDEVAIKNYSEDEGMLDQEPGGATSAPIHTIWVCNHSDMQTNKVIEFRPMKLTGNTKIKIFISKCCMCTHNHKL